MGLLIGLTVAAILVFMLHLLDTMGLIDGSVNEIIYTDDSIKNTRVVRVTEKSTNPSVIRALETIERLKRR